MLRDLAETFWYQQNMTNDYLQRLPEHLRNPGKQELGEIELLLPDDSGTFGIVHEDNYIMLIKDRVRFPDGREGGYACLINQGELAGSSGVVMIPIWAGSVVFIRIFRHATRSWEWELPRGFHEAGLTEMENSRKEIREELGVDAATTRKIGDFNANSGLLTGLIGVYVVELSIFPSSGGNSQTAESITELRLALNPGCVTSSQTIRCAAAFLWQP